jgi:hypothetical protein
MAADHTNNYNPWTIMLLPEFWRGALAARQGEADLLVHRLLAISERGENVFKSEEFSQWIGHGCRRV